MRVFCLVVVCLCVFCACEKKEHASKKPTAYVIGVDDQWFPLELYGKEPQVYGFATEVLREIARQRKLQVTVHQASWNTLIKGLKDGQYGGILTSILPLESRLETLRFSRSFFYTGPVLVVRKESSYASLEDLQERIVAVEVGTSSVVHAGAFARIILKNYDHIEKALDDLAAKKIDAAFVNLVAAHALTQNVYKDSLKVIDALYGDEGLRLAVTVDGSYDELLKEFNQGLTEIKGDGRYEALLKRWKLFQ